MLRYTTILFLVALLLQGNSLQAQDSLQLSRLSQAYPAPPARKEWAVARHNKNEIQALFSGLFLVYKGFFSSQDGQRCTFTPSCSEYGVMAIKHHGLVLGICVTTDRLMRCNGLSPERYDYDPELFLFIDPIVHED